MKHLQDLLEHDAGFELEKQTELVAVTASVEDQLDRLRAPVEIATLNPSHPFHLVLFLIGQKDKPRVVEIVSQCTNAYLVSFIVSYTGGILFGFYAMFRVMAQYKDLALIRLNPRFQFRNRVLAAYKQSSESQQPRGSSLLV